MAAWKRLWIKWTPKGKLSRSRDIVSEYGEVLGNYAHMTWGRPKSRLPFSVDEIKEAIIRVALESLDEPEFVVKLRAGYMELATFIDDEVAESYNQAWLNFTKTDKTSGRTFFLISASSMTLLAILIFLSFLNLDSFLSRLGF